MNEYNQIYTSIENEVIDLSFAITFNEDQKKVYSSKIADLILRSSSLLESALKYLYSGENKRIKYDDDELLKELKFDDQKTAYLHWSLYNFEKRIFIPFDKNEERVTNNFNNVGKSGNQNYSWNNAYQSLRHQFIESIPHFGNLYYLFEILAALYVVLQVESRIFVTLEKDGSGKYFGWVMNGAGVGIRKTFDI